MPQQPILTTKEAIAAVYDLLDRPDQDVLPAALVCSNYWFQLDKILLILELSDRTIFLDKTEFTVPKDATEFNLGEIEFFGSELALEIFETLDGAERKQPVPMLSDMRDLNSRIDLAASLFRDPRNPSIPQLRFSQATAGTYRFRLWFEPGSFKRPGIDERPVIPMEAQSYLCALTARASLPKLADAYTPVHFEAVAGKINGEVEEFGAIFTNWSRKDVAGTPQRRAFNESRRNQGRYGAAPRPGRRRGPIIGGIS